MDFPIHLSSGRFVRNSEELEQMVRVLLQNSIMSFCQSYDKGSYFSLHQAMGDGSVDIKRTLEQEIKGLQVINIESSGDAFTVYITYNGEEVRLNV